MFRMVTGGLFTIWSRYRAALDGERVGLLPAGLAAVLATLFAIHDDFSFRKVPGDFSLTAAIYLHACKNAGNFLLCKN
jgi:hypothetical protein